MMNHAQRADNLAHHVDVRDDWTAPPVRSPVADLLDDLGRALDLLGISCYLFGAQAATCTGWPD